MASLIILPQSLHIISGSCSSALSFNNVPVKCIPPHIGHTANLYPIGSGTHLLNFIELCFYQNSVTILINILVINY